MAGVPQGAFAARKVRQACEAGRLWKQNLPMDEGLPLEERFHLAEAGELLFFGAVTKVTGLSIALSSLHELWPISFVAGLANISFFCFF